MDVIALAQQLIRVPSPVHDGNEVAVVALLQDVLQELGLPRGQVHAAQPDRPNLVTTVDFGPGGRHLALCGHIDTKPVGEAGWTVDPFAADVEDGRLYGLGSADMKAAVAAMLCAVVQLVQRGDRTAGRVSLVLTADEEAGALYGARHLAPLLDPQVDAMVIGEPGGIHADFDQLHVVSRGLGRFRVAARARQGHSSLSSSHDMRNAGVDLARAVVALAEGPVPAHPPNPGLRGWEVTQNPALSHTGGIGYGVLPEWMATSLEVRTLPGMSPEETLRDVRDTLARIGAQHGACYEVEFDGEPHWLAGTAVAPDDPIVTAALAAARATLGQDPPMGVFPGTTDASWFALQLPDLPCLPALGPGLLSRAHAADEWVSVDAVRSSVGIYESLTRGYLDSAPERADA